MVNDVHRTIKIEDEYLEYSKALQDETIDEFILRKSYETSLSEKVKELLEEEIKKYVYEDETEEQDGSEVAIEESHEENIDTIEDSEKAV